MRRSDREVTGTAELAGILDRAEFLTLAFSDGGSPALVPLSFGYRIDESGKFVFYFHAAQEGRKIDCLKADPRASLSAVGENRIVLADPACRSTCLYESVMAAGQVVFVTDPAEKRLALDLLMQHCGAHGSFDYPAAMLDRTAILRFNAETVTGKSNLPRN